MQAAAHSYTCRMDVEMRDLRLFMALAEDPHFSRAAASQRVSQPTLTRSLARLERTVGVRLVDRTTRRVVLTDAGEQLSRELSTIVPRLDAAIRAVSAHPVLRLGFTWLLPSELVRDVLSGFHQATGGSIALVRRDDRFAGVTGGQTDVAILYGTIRRNPALRIVELGTESRVAAVARDHPLARRRRLRWAELADHPLVVNAGSGTVGPTLWPAGARPEVSARCQTYDECFEMVAAGAGLAVLPESARQRARPGIRYIAIADAPPVSLLLVQPERAGHPLAPALEELALAAARHRRAEPC
jgi:DNA-binding transcriptional LysR family regulator